MPARWFLDTILIRKKKKDLFVERSKHTNTKNCNCRLRYVTRIEIYDYKLNHEARHKENKQSMNFFF